MAQGEALGVLHVRSAVRASVPGTPLPAVGVSEMRQAPTQQLAVTLAEQVALALANLKLRETLRLQSIRDPLTGLYNRRYLEETLERELHRAARHHTPLGVIMLDIDHFKNFNDTFGHAAGDQLLQHLGTYLRANSRKEDIVCRYGGEEIVLIMPDATPTDVFKRAEQLRLGVKDLQVQYRGQSLGVITLSAGVAACHPPETPCADLLHEADRALYRAKRAGRDRVLLANAAPRPE
jgi:diguanylate cyclase (GGDEF)-like protein